MTVVAALADAVVAAGAVVAAAGAFVAAGAVVAVDDEEPQAVRIKARTTRMGTQSRFIILPPGSVDANTRRAHHAFCMSDVPAA